MLALAAMTPVPLTPGSRGLLSLDRFGALLRALRDEGHELVGPTVQGGAIVHARIEGPRDLPEGIGDEQAPGRYRLRARGDRALFGFAVGPHSYKRELLAPRVRLFRIRRSAAGSAVEPEPLPDRKIAFIGARACEIAAIGVQDRVLEGGPYADADYRARRRGVFVVAVQCSDPSGVCFCASMGTGPRATRGFDLALTEIVDAPHRFVVEIGTEDGARVLAKVGVDPATDADLARADRISEEATQRMGRTLDTRDLPRALSASPEHPRWDDVAARCLGCANCTMVCPTCFCTTVEDTTDLSGSEAERHRRWDSCFTLDYSHVHGGPVRASLRARYRQWLTHKLSTWHDQFGTSGCVGCGRCITWCPVGIDITEEAAAIKAPAAGGGA
jgi:sulfhydrogenase subunit beta (sulfur reductase)